VGELHVLPLGVAVAAVVSSLLEQRASAQNLINSGNEIKVGVHMALEGKEGQLNL
jgi:hypothetical protein